MQSLLKDKENNIAEKENFAKTTNESICGWCKFKKICSKED